jgi:hypothetical protein
MATITVTPIKTFVSGETVTPAKLNELSQSTVALTAGTIVDADVADGAVIALSKLATGALPAAITVSSANMVTATAQSLLPAGAVMPFARATAPAGWLIANGDAVPNGSGTVQGVTADFAALYAAVSTGFGAIGTLPDLRGIFVRGSGSQTIGGVGYTGTFALKESDALKTHTHTVNGRSGIGYTIGGVSANGANISGSETTSNPSTGTSTETRPANIALLYCIKF